MDEKYSACHNVTADWKKKIEKHWDEKSNARVTTLTNM